jgi:large conductance mechanosensitive channel
MLREFREFVTRGNIVELSVAVIMGLAFTTVVNSVVADLITPVIAAIVGQPDFSRLTIDVGDSVITYGNFLNALFSFVIVAIVVFLVVKAYNRFRRPAASTTRGCPFCATEIPIGASRCPNCTSQLEGAPA